MANHLMFMKGIIIKPIFVLKKDLKSGRRPSPLVPEALDTYIDDIVEEQIIDVNTKSKQIVNRIFVGSDDGGNYCNVGWLLNDDIHYCMLCRTAFGMFTYKHHCKACGNIVCENCSLNRAYIFEIQSLGMFRTCNLCFFGQELVYAVNNRPIRELPPAIVTPVESSKAAKNAPVVTAEESAEEKKKKLRAQQQLAFQREATKRMSNLGAAGMGSTSPMRGSTIVGSPAGGLSPPPSHHNTNSNNSNNNPPVTPPPAPPTTSTSTLSPINGSSKIAKIAAQVGPLPSIGGNDFERDNQTRKQRLSKYGAMQPVVPTPGFVIKTKRSNGVKVFLNICSSEKIPFKPEPSGSSNNTANAEIDPNKLLYMIVSTPLEYQNEKDNSYCIIYDIVVHPDEVFVCSINSSGAARHRLCTQALELVTATYYETVDPSYVILRLASNYKGKDDSGKPAVRVIALPPADAFYALNQIAAIAVTETATSTPTTPTAASGSGTTRQSLTKESSMRNLLRGSSVKVNSSTTSTAVSSTEVEGVLNNNEGRLSTIRESSITGSRATVVDLLEDTGKYGFDTTMKVMIMPREELENLTAKNFNTVLEAMSQFEQDIKHMIIYPEAGFVILAQQIRPVRRIFINVCHHRMVGLKTKTPTPTASKGTKKEIPRPCPFIIGHVDESYSDREGKAMVVNLVIPTSVITAVIEDLTGDLRDQLAIEILQRLSSLNILLDSNFALPLIPGGYVSKETAANPSHNEASPLVIIPPVLNLTEYEKTEYAVGFLGKLYKQGHRFKSWKERLVFFSDSKMQYFDMKMIYCGEFEFEDCSINNLQPSECQAPNNSYPFQMKNFASGGEYLYCYVNSEVLRELYRLVLQVKNHHLTAIKVLINIPLMKTGWLKKQGHLIKNWKERFFILNYGILQYYEKNGQDQSGTAETPKGKVNLKNATVTVVLNDENGKALDGEHRLLITEANGSKLYVQMKTAGEKKEWFEAIRKHIDYAKEFME